MVSPGPSVDALKRRLVLHNPTAREAIEASYLDTEVDVRLLDEKGHPIEGQSSDHGTAEPGDVPGEICVMYDKFSIDLTWCDGDTVCDERGRCYTIEVVGYG